MADPLVSLDRVRYFYPESEEIGVGEFNLAVYAGERVTVRGASPSGKSTLIGLLSGALPHQWGGTVAGTVAFGAPLRHDGTGAPSLSKIPALVEAPAERWSGFLETGRAELELDLIGRGWSGTAVTARVNEVAERLGIAATLDRPPQQLSGGQQQRLALASLLVAPSPLVVADEALAHLDDVGVRHARDAFCTLVPADAAVVETTSESGVSALADGRPRDVSASPKLYDSQLPATDLRLAEVPARKLSLRVDGAGYGGSRVILRDLEISLEPGEIVGLLGPNGVGKSTAFACIMGLLDFFDGELSLEGVPGFARLSPGQRARYVAYALQSPIHQLYHKTVREELLLGPGHVGRTPLVPPEAIIAEADAVFPVRHLLARHPRALSRGELRRIGILAMLTMDRGTLLLDEPTVGLDRAGGLRLQRYLNAHAERGGSALIASHDRAWLAQTCGRTITLSPT